MLLSRPLSLTLLAFRFLLFVLEGGDDSERALAFRPWAKGAQRREVGLFLQHLQGSPDKVNKVGFDAEFFADVADIIVSHRRITMPVARGQKGVRQELHKFKAGTLHSGSKRGPVVTNRKQAIAIALSEAGLSKGKRSTKR